MIHAELQALIDNATVLDPNGRRWGGIVNLPPGVHEVDDTLRIHNVRGLRLVGYRSRIIWTGPPTKPVVSLAGAFQCSLEGVDIAAQNASDSAAVLISNLPVRGDWITSQCRLIDVSVPHFGTPPFKYGISVDSWALGGGDQNNEHHLFERVTLSDYTDSGCYIRGGQAHQLVFRDCHFNSETRDAKYGIYGAYGNYWSWEGGSCSHHTEADFAAIDFTTRVMIRNFNGEHSRRFLITGGPTGAPLPIFVEGVRWDGAPGPDDYAISYLSPGPLVLANSHIMANNGNRLRVLSFPPAGMEGGSLSVRNCVLGQYNGETAPLESPIRCSGQEVDEFGLTYRWMKGSEQELHPFCINWPADLSRCAVELPPIQTEYQSDGPAQIVDLSDFDLQRGWSIACTATLTPGPVHPTVFSLTPGIMLWCVSRQQWRLEGTGLEINLVEPVPYGVPQNVIVGYDQEKRTAFLSVNGQRVDGGNLSLLATPTAMAMATNQTWVRFDGTIENMRMWGRMLSKEESN